MSFRAIRRFRLAIVLIVTPFVTLHAQMVVAGNCETGKAKALVKLNKDSLKCSGKAEYDPSFDELACQLTAVNRCIEGITKAQAKPPCQVIVNAYDTCNDFWVCQVNELSQWAYVPIDPSPSKCMLKRGKA